MTSVRLQFMSDLHLETLSSYDIYDISPNAPHLALLGDIGNTRDDGYIAFLEKQLQQFKTVFVLLGNHEAYHSSWAHAKQRLQDLEARALAVHDANPSSTGRLVFLDQRRHDLSDTITVLGCTLHSHIPTAQAPHVSLGLNDSYHITDWTVATHNAAHAANLAWLNDTLASIALHEPQREIVVLTHYSPTTDSRSSDPKHAGSQLASAFSTDLRAEVCWTQQNVRVWAFGHTHWNCDFLDGAEEEQGRRKRVLTNQRGYYFALAEGFEAGKVIEL